MEAHMKLRILFCFVTGVLLSTLEITLGDTLNFTNDFSAWSITAADNSAMGMSNTDSLEWDMVAAAGGSNKKNQWTYSVAGITNIEFDYRFKNDTFYERLEFRLLDAADTVLWTGISSGGGLPPVWYNVVLSGLNTSAVKFEFHHIGDTIYGVPGLFTANQDDWDAEVDNVTITTQGAPPPSSPTQYTILYTDDFSDWVHVSHNFGDWQYGTNLMAASNTDSLAWDLAYAPIAYTPRWESFSTTEPNTVTAIEFDYRYKNDNFDVRVEFRLLDAEDNELWNANDNSNEGGGIAPVWYHITLEGLDTNTVKFEYHQTSDTIYGVAGLFAANQDDWDAEVDNVTLTLDPWANHLDGDVDNNHFVNAKDLNILADKWLECTHLDPNYGCLP